MCRLVVFFALIVSTQAIPLQNFTHFITSYAKVATNGGVKTANEGRSNGQSFFSQRSDARVTSGQNLKPKEVIYHYSMDTNSRVGEDHSEKLPAKGEVVIQDRFNPPPYFNFHYDSDKKPASIPKDSKPTVVYGTPAISSFSSSPPKDVDAKPSSYDSPISSYGPVASGLPDSFKDDSKKNLYDSPISSYAPAPSGLPDKSPSLDDGPGYSYTPPPKDDSMKPPSFDGSSDGYSYNPPSDSKKPSMDDTPGYSYTPPPSVSDSKPPMPSYFPPADSYGPPPKPPQSQPDPGYSYEPPKPKIPKFPGYVYDPPMPDSKPMDYAGPFAPPTGMDDATHDHHDHHHHPVMPTGGDEQGPPITATLGPPADDSFSYHHDDHKDDIDLSPPPSAPQDTFPKQIPEYLDHDPHDHGSYNIPYNFDDHHHHIYHEVSTTTEAPEDERVNKGHYSYYYLGRKLFYIPLYFSVYFIIYVTVLILKSIARHKVNLVHEYPKARSFDGEIETTEQVTKAIDTHRNKYIAM